MNYELAFLGYTLAGSLLIIGAAIYDLYYRKSHEHEE